MEEIKSELKDSCYGFFYELIKPIKDKFEIAL